MRERVFIVGAKRTPIGSYLGNLKQMSAAELGAVAVREALSSAQIDPSTIDEVIIGNALPAGQGQGVARQVAIHAGLSEKIPASSVNMVCGSGLKAVMNAYLSLQAGMGQAIIAGGTEVMSQAPFLISSRVRSGQKMGAIATQDHMLADGLTDAFSGEHMGVTAENIARKYQISRQRQDQFAYHSQQKAVHARDTGAFEAEIVPVTIKNRREEWTLDRDEYINDATTPEKLSQLRPAFVQDGTVTAGNASGLNDGASATILATESYLQDHPDIKPLAEIIAIGQGGVAPEVMGMGPVEAVQSTLKRAELTLDEMDLIELNEAFAAQGLAVMDQLADIYEISFSRLDEKTNVNGGAIALGHPIGASGNRILVTLIHALKNRHLSYGLASLCVGGGMGVAMVIKSVFI